MLMENGSAVMIAVEIGMKITATVKIELNTLPSMCFGTFFCTIEKKMNIKNRQEKLKNQISSYYDLCRKSKHCKNCDRSQSHTAECQCDQDTVV